MSADEQIKVGDAAMKAAEEKRKAKEEKRKATKPKVKKTKAQERKGQKPTSKDTKPEDKGPTAAALARYAKNIERASKDYSTALDGEEMSALVKWQVKLDDFHRKQVRTALDEIKTGLRKFDRAFMEGG
jgi:hypothetical protein